MKQQETPPAGVVLVDKPAGPSSFAMVQRVRRAMGIKKVGHTGTLDPFASGLLVICVGRPATRIIPRLMDGDKVYVATLRLGVETDTHDLEGRVTARHPVPDFPPEVIADCLARFTGPQMQKPPAFSAVKHKGKPLYHYARKGISIEKEARPIVIHALTCVERGAGHLTISVRCGKGTYIRTLAHDIGRALGCGAHLTALRRVGNGPFTVDEAIDGARLADKTRARQAILQAMMGVEQTLALVEGGEEKNTKHNKENSSS